MPELHLSDRFRSAFGLRRGEGPTAFAFFAYLVLVISCYVISKSVRDALFISRFGAFKLPYMYIGIAAIAGVFVSIYIRLARRVSHEKLVSGTLVFFAVNLFVFWWLLRFKFGWLYPAIYFWAGIFGVIAPMQVWTLSNFIYTTRQAKRLYGFIGAGGILGAVIGGFFSSEAVKRIGTDNLLLAIILFIAVCVVLVNFIWRTGRRASADEREAPRQPQNLRQSLAIILKSRYLTLIAVVITLSQVVSTVIDFQFKAVAEQIYPAKDQLTHFFGSFYGYLGILSFILQIFLTSRLLRRLGVGIALFILPLAVGAGSLALLVWTGLAAALAAKGPDQLLKHSVDKSASELLYLPVASDIKPAVKSFIDTVLWRIADASAGALVLGLTAIAGLSVRGVSAVTLGIIGVWMVALMAVRYRYRDALRAALAEGGFGLDARPPVDVRDPETAVTFIKSLHSRNTEDVLYALEIIRATRAGGTVVPHVQRLLTHDSEAVRAAALDALATTGDRRVAEKLTPLFDDESPKVRAKAMHIARKFGKPVPKKRVLRYLRETNYRLRGAAIVWALDRRAKQGHHALATRALESLLRSTNEGARKEAARALGSLRSLEAVHEALALLLQDPSREVVHEALRSAGTLAHPELVPLIVPHLATHSARSAACAALAQCGPAILERLRHYVLEPGHDAAIRRGVVRALAAMGAQPAVDLLLEALASGDRELRPAIVHALSAARARHPELQVSEKAIRHELEAELREYYGTVVLLQAVAPATDDESERTPELLEATLQQRLAASLENVLRLLSLLHPAEDLLRIYRGLSSKDHAVRANAVELLEQLLPQEMKQVVLPALDEEMAMGARLACAERLGIAPPERREAALAELLRSPSPAVALAALDEVAGKRVAELYDSLEELARGEEPLVAATAASVRERLAPPPQRRIA
ncbi:MAG TPA: Npt1/Npt2 family nucleotide transporter [Terriglobales bacterium]|nr:Npt1/Npt2 family nucleotide transporter [Terriglobales bacterium]